jgi:hypothetical protein
MSNPDPFAAAPAQRRGRPKVRYADRGEQVRQNMRLYRARRKAEQHALQRALETLLRTVESGDVQQTYQAGAAVAGLWKESALRETWFRASNAPAAPITSSEKIPLGNSAQVPPVRAEAVKALVFTENALRQAQGERPCTEFPSATEDEG